MTILINSLSTDFGPPGQWVYVSGDGFTLDSTTVLLDNQPVENLNIYNESQIGFSIPLNFSDGFKSIKIQTNDDLYLADDFFKVGSLTEPPILISFISSVIIDDINEWIFVTGENFFWDQTSVIFNEKTMKCFVYSPTSCGFQKNIDETITSLTLTTPNGSVTLTV